MIYLGETRNDLYKNYPKNGIGAEIGVHVGNNAESLLRATDPKKLHLIDAWFTELDVMDGLTPPLNGLEAYRQCRERFQDNPSVILERGMSWDILGTYPDGYFDWVYLDSSHEYNDTLRELRLCGRKVKPSGVISGHDYCDQFLGTKQAVNRFTNEGEWRLVELSAEVWATFVLRHNN